MTNVVRAALTASEAQGTNDQTKWRITLINGTMISGSIREVEGDIYALVKSGGGDAQYFDAAKVLYMWHTK